MQMKMSDVIDRWTILLQKAKFSEEARVELEAYTDVVRGACDDKWYDVILPTMSLMEANAKIWENEAAIRKEMPDDPSAASTLTLEEIGRRALVIRGHNKQRCEAKQALDKYFDETPDVKVDHASGK